MTASELRKLIDCTGKNCPIRAREERIYMMLHDSAAMFAVLDDDEVKLVVECANETLDMMEKLRSEQRKRLPKNSMEITLANLCAAYWEVARHATIAEMCRRELKKEFDETGGLIQ